MSFLGAWLVSEYVYNPNGRLAGIIQQRRELEQLDNGRIRVTQHCQPSAELDGHPMARFTGEPVFELSIDGRYRRYHGPAVIGTGISWGEGAMTGRGIWPEFGHNFRSFAVLPSTNLQLTGGKFFNATEMIANIAGVAVPEAEADGYPILPQTYAPETDVWLGTCTTVMADGSVIVTQPIQRTFVTCHDTYIHWQEDGTEWHFTTEDGRTEVQAQQLYGTAKQFGPLLEMELVYENGRTLEQLELLDTMHNHLIAIRRWYQDEILERVEVLRLRPQ